MQKIGLFIVLLSNMLLGGCIDLASNDGKDRQQYLKTIATSRAQVYTMRGGLGGIFSKGMNRLQDTLKQDKHLYVSSTVWYKAYDLSQFIIANEQKGVTHGPVILVGHSLGANEQIKVAKHLQRAHIPVLLLITVDAVSPIKVPDNVQYAVNLYKPSFVPMFSGLLLKAENPIRTHIDNINIDHIPEVAVNHFSIDGHPKIQQIMLSTIYEKLATAHVVSSHDSRSINRAKIYLDRP